jgi:hypothetical protein
MHTQNHAKPHPPSNKDMDASFSKLTETTRYTHTHTHTLIIIKDLRECRELNVVTPVQLTPLPIWVKL